MRKAVLLDLQLVQALNGYLQEQPYKMSAPFINAITNSPVIDVPDESIGGGSVLEVPKEGEEPLASAARARTRTANNGN